MAEGDKDQEKTEQATPKRKEDARKRGQVAQSREVASVAILSACLVYFYFNTPGVIEKIKQLMVSTFREAGQIVITQDNIQSIFTGFIFKGFLLLFPLLLTVVIAGLLANIIQVGLVFSAESLEPKLSKIDPLKGLQRLLSLKSVVELFKNILKVFIVGYIAYVTVRGEAKGIFPLMDQSVGEILLYIGKISFKIIFTTCWVLIILAVMDYAYQRWEYEKSLKMSKQEIKDEHKHSEGDPIVKARIKRLQREMARKRMMASVPKADVVITNPTHIAVALQYDQSSMIAPVVVAKGAGFIAEKIKEIANENNVPVVEDKPMARVLYKMVDINKVIPENLYRAVAEILAYVYGLKKDRGN
ncbi:MAG: flagellar biosynthesis protein FlhB [Deltaproteobacteria bacterium]|nr:flagellar biosynthesis protein FlhB [Deltaproteobacteria bacterium]